jgi:phage-related protein
MSDFTAVPDRAIQQTIEFKVLVTEFENLTEQRRQQTSNSRNQFRLSFVNRTQAEMEAVRDFFNAKKSSLTSFTWTNPNDSVEYTVRFLENSFSISRQNYQIYNFEVGLIQVI